MNLKIKSRKGKQFALILIIFILLASVIYSVSAVPLNPEDYWGYVYAEGELVPDGTVLMVETVSGEHLVNQTIPLDPGHPGSYHILVNFDDFVTPEDEGAEENEQLVWKVDGKSAIQPSPGSDTAVSGKTNNNFIVIGVFNPNISVGLAYSNQSVIFGGQINLTVLLNNSGKGAANVTVFNITGANITNITTDLPKYLKVAKNSTNQTQLKITPLVCGGFSPDLIIYYYNQAGELVDAIAEPLSFNALGYDIEIVEVSASDYSIAPGDEITVGAVLSNKGDFDVNRFNLTFYDSLNGSAISSVNSNLTLGKGENISVTFNWQLVEGSHVITADVSIAESECSYINNIKNSSAVTVSSGGGGGGSGSGAEEPPVSYPETPLAPDDSGLDILDRISGNEDVVQNITQPEENKTEKAPVTGMATKEKEAKQDFREMLPDFILMLILLFILIALFYWYRKKKEKKEKGSKKEAKQKPKEAKPKPEAKKETKKEIKTPSHIHHSRSKLNILNLIKKSHEKGIKAADASRGVKIRPRNAVFSRPIKPGRPAAKIPKVKVRSSRDAGLVNLGSMMGLIKEAKEKEMSIVVEEPDKPEQEKRTHLPYEYLAMAVELVDKITMDKQPRDELIRKYSSRYPQFLIELAGRHVFLNDRFNESINVIEELHKLKVLDKDYSHIHHDDLIKAVDIIAKGYAQRENS
jgi:hypothetical protein